MKSLHVFKAMLVGVAAAAVLGATGCASALKAMSANYDPISGKTVRLEVYLARTAGPDGLESSALAHKMFNGPKTVFKMFGGIPTPEEFLPYRWVGGSARGAWKGVGVLRNGPTGPMQAVAADGVPLLKEGDWVDAYVPEGGLLSWVFKERRFLTIVKRVCKVEDKACQKREAELSGKPRGQIVDESFDASTITISPHYDLSGEWLPGKKPAR